MNKGFTKTRAVGNSEKKKIEDFSTWGEVCLVYYIGISRVGATCINLAHLAIIGTKYYNILSQLLLLLL